MSEIAEKTLKDDQNPIITDLNMIVGNMIIAGKSKSQVARELGITPATVSHHVKRLKALTGSNDDRVNDHRSRLIGKLGKTEKVIDYALSPKQFKRSPTHLTIAANMTLALNKGLGVLVERSETPVVNFEDKRQQVIVNLGLAEQFGASIPQEIRAEIVENSDQVGVKQADSDSQAVVPDADVENVSRETSAKPDIPPTT